MHNHIHFHATKTNMQKTIFHAKIHSRDIGIGQLSVNNTKTLCYHDHAKTSSMAHPATSDKDKPALTAYLNSTQCNSYTRTKKIPREKAIQDTILTILSPCKERTKNRSSEAHGIYPTKTPHGLKHSSNMQNK